MRLETSSVGEHHSGDLGGLHDISLNEKSTITSRGLNASGMEGIAVPLNLDLGTLGMQTQFAKAKATVNTVNGEIKGIHMSRLFIELTERLESEPFSLKLVREILEGFIASHEDISDQAQLGLSFDWPYKRSSLNSGNSGWRLYPVTLNSSMSSDGELNIRLQLTITYASFCPCSASLARQLLQNNFQNDYQSNEKVDVREVVEWLGRRSSINAIPHGQRSTAHLSFDWEEGKDLNLSKLIDYVEAAIKTPVQTAVKRSDEQEFANVCGDNLMFVEDAVKIFYRALQNHSDCKNIRVSVAHHESLHAHDAVAVIDEASINHHH